MSHHDHANCNHDHGHEDHGHEDHGHDHNHDHDHHAPDPGEVIAEKSPQDKLLIGICAIAMILLMSFIGSWMQIQVPTGGGHGEGAEHTEHAPQAGAETHAPETHASEIHAPEASAPATEPSH